MKLRALVSVFLATALMGPAASALAQWSYSFNDMGVDYTLTDLTIGDATTHSYSLTLDTTGYKQASGAYLDSVDIKAWDGTVIDFTLVDAPNGASAWGGTEGPISSGPSSNTGCGVSGSGFACVEAFTKGTFDVASGSAYTFLFDVTADSSASFLSSPMGAHIGAGYADINGAGRGYGITSVTAPIPEPETYALLLAGLGLLGIVARRRKKTHDLAAALA